MLQLKVHIVIDRVMCGGIDQGSKVGKASLNMSMVEQCHTHTLELVHAKTWLDKEELYEAC